MIVLAKNFHSVLFPQTVNELLGQPNKMFFLGWLVMAHISPSVLWEFGEKVANSLLIF